MVVSQVESLPLTPLSSSVRNGVGMAATTMSSSSSLLPVKVPYFDCLHVLFSKKRDGS